MDPDPEPRRFTRTGLVRINVYWLALTTMWTAISIQMAPRLAERLICPAGMATLDCGDPDRLGQLIPIVADLRLPPEGALSILAALGAIVAFTVQPIAAAISDSTRTRAGRRRPWIVAGAVGTIAILLLLATAGSFLVFLLLGLALQFASNVAQGPYQGVIPDLVPEDQVGAASGLKATMNAAGQLGGALVGGLAVLVSDPRLGFLGLAMLVAVLAVATVTGFREPALPPPPPRTGSRTRAVRAALVEAWSNRDFVWLMVSMLFLLMATATLVTTAPWYLTRTLGYSDADAATAIAILLALTVCSAIVAALWGGPASDRHGRRTIIWLSAAISAAGMVVLVVAQREPELVLDLAAVGATVRFPAFGLAAIPVGTGAGMYLAANWALLVDVIPKATAGRHLGISNIVTASSGAAAAIAMSVLMFLAALVTDAGFGPRAALVGAVAWYVVGVLALRRVHEPERRPVPETGAMGGAPA